MKIHSFLERLSKGPILCDGAMGTLLYARGVPTETCFDMLNLTRPDMVSDIHRAYLAAGADIIETNTFGANRIKLEERGIAGSQVVAINAAGVQLARQAAANSGRSVFVAGSIGPLGKQLTPLGSITPQEAHSAFAKQISALAETGADVLILETFGDLDELLVGIRTAQETCDLPIIAQMTFTADQCTPLGCTPEQVALRLAETGVAVIGANCSVGPARILSVVEAMCAALSKPNTNGEQSSLPASTNTPGSPRKQASNEGETRREIFPHFSAQPNAGWPEASGGRLFYPATSDYFANAARRFALAGVTVIGGCCGTTPDHIRAMRLSLDALALSPHRPAGRAIAAPPREEVRRTPEPPTELERKLQAGHFVISVEMSPPKGFDVGRVLSAALMLKQNGVDAVDITDSPRARMRTSPWAVAHLVRTEVDLEVVLHFPVRGRNLLRVQGDLLAAHALHVRNIFVVMGDPPAIGDYPQATDTHDIVPSGLVKLLKQNLNRGVDRAGASIGAPCSFTVGVALDPGARDMAHELKTLRKKIEAGADFALTQPVFDPQTMRDLLRRYADDYGPLRLPVLLGILPLASARHAEFLHNEVPGMTLPHALLDRMRLAGDRGREEGIKIARQVLMELKDVVQGVYLMPPFGRFDTAVEVFEGLVEREGLTQR